MSQFPESTFDDPRQNRGFVSLLGIAFGLVVAVVGIAVIIAAV
jgi:hypothetical protein